MANEEHLALLKQGASTWNDWREMNPGIQPDLSEASLVQTILIYRNLSQANLSQANLRGADLQQTDLRGANLSEAYLKKSMLYRANLSGANLSESDLSMANLSEANLSSAYLQRANLSGAHLYRTNFCGADLGEANFMVARLIETNFEKANLTGCLVYGISVWGVKLEGATQSNLVITNDEPTITVDNLEVAQFIYLLLNNQKIREAIDTITSKVVLILGSFTPERKEVLDALRDELRKRDYLPVVFDFDGSASQTTIETVFTLANMAKFVIADLTDARSVLQELQAIVPALPSVPVQPILLASAHKYGMLDHIRRYPWVLETYQYQSPEELLTSVATIITPAEAKAKELRSG